MTIYKKIINTLIFGLLTSIGFAQTTTVSGTITGAKTNTTVTIKGDNFEQSVALDENGNYQFQEVPVGLTVSIAPFKEDAYLNGVSTFDLVLNLRHILSIVPFEITREYIAADINVSGNVSIADLVLHRRLLLGDITEFPDVDSWRFIEQSQYEAIEMDGCIYTNEFTNTFIIQEGENVFNFVGVKMADTNGQAIEN